MRLEQQVEEQATKASERESRILALKAEIEKANEIIKRLQEELRSAKHRLKAANSLAQQHERTAKDATDSAELIRRQLAECRSAIEASDARTANQAASEKRLQAELAECKRRLAEVEFINNYLHEQVDELAGARSNEIIARIPQPTSSSTNVGPFPRPSIDAFTF